MNAPILRALEAPGRARREIWEAVSLEDQCVFRSRSKKSKYLPSPAVVSATFHFGGKKRADVSQEKPPPMVNKSHTPE